MSTLTTLGQHSIGSSSQWNKSKKEENKTKKRNKKHTDWGGRTKTVSIYRCNCLRRKSQGIYRKTPITNEDVRLKHKALYTMLRLII